MSTRTKEATLREGGLSPEAEAILHRPEVLECIQCGTCSASCPTAYAMDYTPRQIIAALRAGQLEKVLKSNTPWLCASCYYCTVRCPAGIQFTDFMYDLKRLALQRNLNPRGSAEFYKATVSTVDLHGRSAEMELMIRYYLSRLNPFGLVKLLPFGLKMLVRGRLPLLPHRIKGRADLSKMFDHIAQKGEA
jgi:heterodisulfide reductase subunit C